MRYSEDFDRSLQISRAALETMAENRIPMNPANYAVWYAYAAGSEPKLKQSLKSLLNEKVSFTTNRNSQIYEEFFGSEGEARAVESVGSGIQRCAEELILDIRSAKAHQGEFGSRIGTLSETLSDTDDPGEIGSVVHGILVETQSILAKSRNLEEKLAASTKEIESLRADLDSIRQEALTDALTGIANRKCFDQVLQHNAGEAAEAKSPLSLLILDIDHFKKFNDSYGHAVGDSVLRVVGGQLKQSVKGRDLPARYGGEEFCILLPNTALEDAAKLADKIRMELGARQLRDTKSDKTYGTITLSIGVALFRFGETLEDFIDRADQALYKAKQQGRNRVLTEQDLQAALSVAG